MSAKINKSTKVLFFSFWYPNIHKPNYAMFVKRHAQAMSTGFETEVLAIHIVQSKTLYKLNYQLETDEQGLKTHHLYLSSSIYKVFYVLLPLQYWLIKKLIKKRIKPEFNFNVIHSNVIFPCGIIGHHLSEYFNCKHIISEHWSKIDKFFKVSLYKNQGKRALNTANAITCVSLNLKNTVQKYHHNKNCFVIPNVIDDANFYYDKTIQKNGILSFIAIAHWHAPKNPFYFLDALKQLQHEQKLPEFKVVLVGSGELLDKVKSLQYNFNIETPGNLNPKDLMHYLNTCHIFLHGSDYETFSVVIIEALRCGLPSVVSPVGIAAEVINESNGFVVLNNVFDWKDKILRVLNSKYDSKIISDAIGNTFSSKTIGNKFAEIYKKVGA